MLENELRVQVIILTYKERFHLLETVLQSFIDDAHINDVLLVDNGCNYDLEREVNGSGLEGKIRVIKIKEPLGTTKAFNESFKVINKKSTHVLILDDDNVLSGSLESIAHIVSEARIVNLLREEREPYASFYKAGKNVTLKKNSFYGFSLFSYLISCFYGKCLGVGDVSSVEGKGCFIEADYLPFGGTIFPVSLLSSVSLDVDFILYHDDIDFFYRSKEVGYKLIITSLCKVIDIDHSWHNSSVGLLDSIRKNPVNVYYAIRNKIYFEKKVSTSKLNFYLNMLVWRLHFFVKNRRCFGSNEYALLNQAIEDGLTGNLGIFNKRMY
jgi:GT2 family glycosyltransferase